MAQVIMTSFGAVAYWNVPDSIVTCGQVTYWDAKPAGRCVYCRQALYMAGLDFHYYVLHSPVTWNWEVFPCHKNCVWPLWHEHQVRFHYYWEHFRRYGHCRTNINIVYGP